MSVPHCFDDYSFVLQIHYFKFLPELGGDEGEGGWIEGEKAGVAQGRMQHQGRDGSGEAIYFIPLSQRKGSVGLGLGCRPGASDVNGIWTCGMGRSKREREASLPQQQSPFAPDLHVEWRGHVESWKGLHQPIGWRALRVKFPQRFCLQAVTVQFGRGSTSPDTPPAWPCHLGLER